MTIVSPWLPGSTEVRTSISRPWLVRKAMRPSWGLRFSAMSRPAMILRRDVRGPSSARSSDATSRSTPSMRRRTRTRFAKGSTCTSEARCTRASSSVRATSRMMGASSSSALEPGSEPPAAPARSLPPASLRIWSFSAVGGMSAHCTWQPATNPRLSATKVFSGSSMATHNTPSLNSTGRASFCSTCSSGTFCRASCWIVSLAGSTNFRPWAFASTRQTAASSASPRATMARSSGSPREDAALSAFARRSRSRVPVSASSRRKVSWVLTPGSRAGQGARKPKPRLTSRNH